MSVPMTFILGKVETNLLEQPVALFNADHTAEWLNTELGKHIIRTIDKTEVKEGSVLLSPVLGAIPPDRLSCGCKSVLLAAFHPEAEKYVFDGAKMGDNCYPVLFNVVNQTKRKLKVQVGRLLRESWGENDTVLFTPKNDIVKGYAQCFDYLAAHTHLFWKGEGYGTQG
jgi:hypothetical protein